MAYDYDTDILAALWTGGEDGEEPYASLIAANPDLFDEASENRILSTVEAIRAHMELLADRDEARLFHFCLSTMLEGFGSGGFIYGATSNNELAIVEGNTPFPVFAIGDDIDIAEVDGVTVGANIGTVVATGTDLDTIIADINGAGLTDAAGGTITASRTPDSRLRLTQSVAGGNTRATGFVITRGVGANDSITVKAGIATDASAGGTFYLPKVIEVANAARDRALQVFEGQIRDPSL